MKINLPKIWNVFFHALIVGTLLLCLFMMTKYFFFKDNKPLELGNLSDWISSLSTLGTLVIAYKAFKAAPNWLSQKFDEESLKTGLAINRIVKNEYKNTMSNIRHQLSGFEISESIYTLWYYNIYSPTEKNKKINESIGKINSFMRFNIYSEILKINTKLENEITKLNMIEWHIIPEKNIILTALQKKIQTINTVEMKAKKKFQSFLIIQKQAFTITTHKRMRLTI